MTEARLPVGPSAAADAGRGLARIPREVMARMGLRPGDTVVLEHGRRTHARAVPQRDGAGGLGLCATLAENARAPWGAVTRLEPAALPDLASLDLAALDLGAEGPLPAGAELGLALCDMVVTVGDRLDLTASFGRPLRCEVRAVEPGPAGHVTSQTVIRLVPPPTTEVPGYPGIGGMAGVIARVHEMVDLPLQRPDLFASLGIAPPRGVLFVGPPGTGKTLLARAVAERTGAAFFHVSGPELVSKHYGDSEAALRRLFEAAAKAAPAILFIDEIDSIAPRREGLSGEKQVERRIVAQLLTLMDGLADRGRVVVMAATNLPDGIDPALRRPGRFDREIRFDTPDAAARAEILAVHLAGARLAGDVDLAGLAAAAHGYVGADLAHLTREAALASLARVAAQKGGMAGVRAEDLQITAADLQAGLAQTHPSALRDGEARFEPLRFGDLGGLQEAKAALTRAVLWPLGRADLRARLRLDLPGGVLLAGPPGTGKTLLARALAGESGMNVIAVPPARLMSQFLGEAERAIADLFRRARAAAPCLLLFDELDAVAPRRGRNDAAMDRILGQFLLELDGQGRNGDLVVVGTTNRAAAIDPALLRPGRFDLVISVGLPDAAARAEILAVHLRGRPQSAVLDLAALAAATEGLSSAALAGLVKAAAQSALSRVLTREMTEGTAAGRVPDGGLEGALEIGPQDFAAALAMLATSEAARAGQWLKEETG